MLDLWQLGAFAAVFVVGFLANTQYVKDKIKGVHPELRAALSAQEAVARKMLQDAQATALAKIVKTVAPAMPVPATPAPVVTVLPAAPSPVAEPAANPPQPVA